MALIFSVNPSNKTWKQGKQDSFTLKVYSTVGPWDKTSVAIGGTSGFTFTGYSVKSTPLIPISIKNGGLSADTTGRNQPLNFVAEFAGGASAAFPLEIQIFATPRNVVGEFTATATATVSINDGSKKPESKTVNTKVSIVNAEGVSTPPDVPQKLKAVPIGAIGVDLTWKQVPQATSIIVSRDTDSTFSTEVQWTIPGDPGQYTDLSTEDSPALVPATEYFYRIKAANSLLPGGTDWSNVDRATTTANPDAPPAPTNLKAAKATKSTVKVSWKSIPTVTLSTSEGKAKQTPTYQVSYGTTTGGPYTVFGSYDTSTNATVEALAPNTTYFFVVKASYLESPGVVSGYSNEDSSKTDNTPGLPLAPTGFSATPGHTPDTIGNIVLAWTDPNNGNASYIISRSTSSTGPFVKVVETAPGAVTYTDTGRAAATTYYYQIYAKNTTGPSNVASANATTDALPDSPANPVDVIATAISDSQIKLNWNYGNFSLEGEQSFRIRRGTVMGGPYTQVAEVPATTLSYTDSNLSPSATFYYIIEAWNLGGVGDSAEVSATTKTRSSTIVTQSGFSADPQASVMIKQIGGRAIYASNMDRQVVWIAGCWFLAGLKSHLTSPTATKTTGGALEPDTYKIYSKLLRSRGKTRSEFSPVEEITIDDANNRLRIAPALSGHSPDTVDCRDNGFDINGNTIPGADFVEIYIAASGTSNAVLLTTIPINDPIWETPGYYEVPADLDQASLFNNNRRVMEKLGECSLPPACSVIVPYGPRMYAFGETNIGPTPAQSASATPATLSLSNAARTFTVSNYTLTDAIIYHELWVNGAPTGWFVYDVEGTTGYIRNADPVKDLAGWEGSGGSFTIFFFGATPSRMYSSAFYSGEAGGFPTFSPETYCPLHTFDRELFPDDNTDPIAAIVINDSLLIGKPSKWVLARGGSNLGFPGLQFESLSTGSGINSPKTLVKDSQDRAYYLGDTGPYRVTPAGVEKINVQTGNQRLFENTFDIKSVPDANGSWFSREDWYVCTGLDLIGNSGKRDGFVLDLKNNVLMPFSIPMRVTWMEEVKNTSGTYQIDFGDYDSRSGVLFKEGLSVDGIDMSLPSPSAFCTPINAYLKSSIIDTDNRVGVRSFQIHMRVDGGTVACRLSVIRKDRMDDPRTEQVIEDVSFDTDDTRNKFSMMNHSFPNMVVRMDFEMPTNPSKTRMEFRDVCMEVVRRGPIQRV